MKDDGVNFVRNIGSQVKGDLNDFYKIHTELGCFKQVIKLYKDEGSVSSGDMVNSILSSHFSMRNGEHFSQHLKTKGNLDNTK